MFAEDPVPEGYKCISENDHVAFTLQRVKNKKPHAEKDHENAKLRRFLCEAKNDKPDCKNNIEKFKYLLDAGLFENYEKKEDRDKEIKQAKVDIMKACGNPKVTEGPPGPLGYGPRRELYWRFYVRSPQRFYGRPYGLRFAPM